VIARDSSATGTTPATTIVSAGSAASPSRSSLAIWNAITASVSKLNGRSTSVAGSSFITSTNTSSPAASTDGVRIGKCTRTKVSNGELPRLRALASIAGVMCVSPASTDWYATAK
jgi:hypothetical protein